MEDKNIEKEKGLLIMGYIQFLLGLKEIIERNNFIPTVFKIGHLRVELKLAGFTEEAHKIY